MSGILRELIAPVMLLALSGYSCAADKINLPIYEIIKPIQGLLIPGFHSSISATSELSRNIDEVMVKDDFLYIEYDQYSYSSADINPLVPPLYITPESVMKRRLTEVGPSMAYFLSSTGHGAYRAEDMLNRHPFIIANLLEQNCASDEQRKLNSIDFSIRRVASTKQLQIRSLETMNESFVSVKNIPEDVWNKLLVELLRSIKGGKCKAWTAEYLSTVEQEISGGLLDSALRNSLEFHKKIYGSTVLFESYVSEARNRAQVRKIASIYEDRHQNGSRPIFLIGAAHFGGGHGILKIMCDMGWKIRGTLDERNIYSCN